MEDQNRDRGGYALSRNVWELHLSVYSVHPHLDGESRATPLEGAQHIDGPWVKSNVLYVLYFIR